MSWTHVQQVLYVHTSGCYLSLDHQAVRCKFPDDTWKRLPLEVVDSIVLVGDVRVSTDLLMHCAANGILVSWVSGFGKPRAELVGPLGSHSRLRSAQHQAHENASQRDELAESFVRGKIHNQLCVLRAAGHDAKGHRKQAIHRAITKILSAAEATSAEPLQRPSALGLEGITSRYYFTGLWNSLTPHSQIPAPTSRVRRPPTDPVNAALSFFYGLVRSAVSGAVHSAGLDPGIGFLHGDTDGQPSLVLDLMEEFRPVADRLAISLFNRRQLRPEHFETSISGSVHLTETGRKSVFNSWHEHRLASVKHATLVQTVPNAVIPMVQARILARRLTMDIPRYRAFEMQ